MMNHSEWQALRDKVAREIWIRESAENDFTRHEAESQWDAMPAHGKFNRRVELGITAGFAMMALEELGCLVAPPSIVPKLKRRAGVQ